METDLKCQRCGACCRQAAVLVEQMPELQAILRPRPDGSCQFLRPAGDGTFGCAIYPLRPDVCRVEKMAEYFHRTTGRSIASHFEMAAQSCQELRDKEQSFTCEQCGACCRNVGELVKVIPALQDTFQPDADGACYLLEFRADGRYYCRDYQNRPDLCRVDKMADFVQATAGTSRSDIFALNKIACLKLRAGKD